MLSLNLLIIITTVLVSISGFNNPQRLTRLVFNPFVIKARGEWYRVVTHAFVHTNWSHLFVNMFVLFFFGGNIEQLLTSSYGFAGKIYFLLLYLGGVVFATLPAFKRHINHPGYNAVGASGAVSAVLFAHILTGPTLTIYLFLAIPMPSFIFGIAYLWYEAWMDKRSNDNVAHDAHFWGALFGVAFMVALDFRYLTGFFTQISHWFTNLF